MTLINSTHERLWSALFQFCQNTEPPLVSVIALLADVRHWCDRHDERYEALDYAAHELYIADIARESGRTP